MKHTRNFASGLIVGVANIIPGVSGGTMAVALGVYEQMLEVMGLKNIRRNIPFLLTFGLGAVLGILGFSHIIEFLLGNYPMATNFTFIGLILGSIPMIWHNAKEQSKAHPAPKWVSVAAFAVMLALMLWMNSANGGNPDVITELNPAVAGYLVVCGAIASFSMILPGVSGSFVMLLLGVYPTFLAALSHLNILMLMPIGLGIVIGLLLGSRLVSWLLGHYPLPTYMGIMGLIIGSLFGIYPGFVLGVEGILSLALMAGAALFTLWFSKKA